MNGSNDLLPIKKPSDGPPPSLLVVIVDTNPYAWSLLSDTLPLSGLIANLLVFINAHLAMHHLNEVALLASHSDSTHWLYPETGASGSTRDKSSSNGASSTGGFSSQKYQTFAAVESSLVRNLHKLVSETTPERIKSKTTTLIGGALSSALAYISRQNITHSPSAFDPFSGETPTATISSVLPIAGNGSLDSSQNPPLTSRILIISVSGDLASQYVPVMNTIFAAQKLRVCIDVLKLFGDTVFLQQASDATGGVYLSPSSQSSPGSNGSAGTDPSAPAKDPAENDSSGRAPAQRMQGLLQYFMLGFLPDPITRRALVMPGLTDVDLRAACFCHRKVVNIGIVCSVCLSIFCEPPESNECAICGSYVYVPPAMSTVPAVIPRKRKKKKKAVAAAGTSAPTPSAGDAA